uniref:Uncharacterized protein n=1 Tax=Clytia hemisphaerica TaxID=252671 RepID=A0A7M5UDV0_9CNID
IWGNFPQKKNNGSVKSLKIHCMANISYNVEHWMNYLPNDKSQEFQSPLKVLGTTDTVEILEMLRKKMKFIPDHLYLICHQNLIGMDFDIWELYGESYYIEPCTRKMQENPKTNFEGN